MRTSVRYRGAWWAVVTATIVLVALAGCSSSADTMSGSVADGGGGLAAESRPAPAGGLRDGAGVAGKGSANGLTEESDRAGTGPGSANRPEVSTRAVIRKGEISVVTKEMNRARVDIDAMLGRYGGYLASEDTSNDRKGRPERSVLVLRVPEPAFDEVMTELAKVGRTRGADRRSEDVTAQVIDVETRVATQEASLVRLRQFLEQADDVDDMIRVESEIATRQAELESLKAQQKYLRDNTAMSTITVRLRTPAAPPPPPAEEDSGFLAGLQNGWRVLKVVLVGAATVAGALLPFAVATALVAAPVWLLVRAARRRRPAPPPPAPEAG